MLVTVDMSLKQNRRADFRSKPRNPITVVLDGVRQNYNLGAIFRLCDTFLVERLIISGTQVMLHKRKLVQAAAGTQRWVPWQEAPDATSVVHAAKAAGSWIAALELTPDSIPPTALQPRYPAVLVLGAERIGISPDVIAMADQIVGIPMSGMANSLNVATAAAIVLYELARRRNSPSR